MMLESTISAFVLSALSLEGARSSERQMLASSWLLMTASLSFSYATPLQKMHPERPLRSLFHPAIGWSMVGQALIHLGAMWCAVHMARDAMGPAKLQQVVQFHRRERLREAKEAQKAAAAEEGDYLASMMAIWTTPFLPNLLNTSVFLVETAQCIAVLLVNYKASAARRARRLSRALSRLAWPRLASPRPRPPPRAFSRRPLPPRRAAPS